MVVDESQHVGSGRGGPVGLDRGLPEGPDRLDVAGVGPGGLLQSLELGLAGRLALCRRGGRGRGPLLFPALPPAREREPPRHRRELQRAQRRQAEPRAETQASDDEGHGDAGDEASGLSGEMCLHLDRG